MTGTTISAEQTQLQSRDSLAFFAALALLYAVILWAKFSLWNANALQSDWTYYNNIFWNTNFRDLWLFSYDRFTMKGYPTYLNEHFAPLLFVVAFVYNHFPWPHALLLAVHGASPILAAIGIRAIGLRLLGDRPLATVIALVFALNPGILWPTISLVYGFQPDSMLPPCAVLAGYGLATRRDGLFLSGLLLGCGIKENVPAYGVIIGACLIAFTDRRRLGLWSIGLSLAIFVAASKGVPYFTHVQNANINVVWKFIDDLIHLHPHFDYTLPEIGFAAVYCTFFLPALAVLPFLAAIGPDLLAIGQVPWATTGTWHVMLPVAVLGIASVFGTARILSSQSWLFSPDRARLVRLYWRFGLVASVVLGPTALWLAYSRYIAQAIPVDRAALTALIELVPPEVGLATTADLDQYFAHRKIVTTRPYLVQKTPTDFAYIAINRQAVIAARREGKAADGLRSDQCMIKLAEKIAENNSDVVFEQGGLLLVKLTKLPDVACDPTP